MDGQEILFSIGDMLNGALQVFTDFINVLIEVLPNPDPFPEMIEQIAWVNGGVWGWGVFWLDSYFGLEYSIQVIGLWAGLMAISAIMALVWMMVKWARG